MEDQKRVHQIINIAWQWIKPYIPAPMDDSSEWDKVVLEGDSIIKGFKGTENEQQLLQDIVLAMMDYLARRHREIG